MVDERTSTPTATTRRVTLKVVTVPEAITVSNLAQRVHVDAVQMVKQLMRMGVFANVTQVVDFDTAAAAVRAFGYSARRATEAAKSASGAAAEEDQGQLKPRPPVVTILGHVDHGKTTLLDAVRNSNVVGGEAGGITQHIGAYQVEYDGHPITFLDTPGHQAFTAMRARGAQVTDIAVLVVAADDGVMPQTVEAIDHIKAAGVPLVVAINKMDMPDADPDRVKRQLSEHELVVEDWGGDVIAVAVSAKQQTGIENLLESIVVVAEVSELQANPNRPAIGVVIEAKVARNRGPLATVLVQTGTLKVGDNVAVGASWGRVKALTNSTGHRIKAAGPSEPVEVLGINGLPAAGDRLQVRQNEHAAREQAIDQQRANQASQVHGLTLEEFGARFNTGQAKEMNLVLKTDVQGSIDAVKTALDQLSSDERRVRIIHAATGSINESDVTLAVASQAVIIGFNSPAEPGARLLAEQDGVEIRFYDIIYRLTDDIQAALEGMLEPAVQEVVEGQLEVRAIFPLGRNRVSAGCYVVSGQIARGSAARVLRGGKVVFDGPVSTLRRFKEDVRQVQAGYECGVTLEGFNNFAVGDVIEPHRQQQARQAP